MKRSIFAAAVVSIAVASFGMSTPAAAQDRYCLQGRIWGYPGNCQFASYGQCMASASGTNAFCGINPRYAYARRWRGYR
ncbi:DUF3551 domain-containing protein [Bradyrhizobium diazoefficiens]|uniref:DUF3551 domain-containing protein n=1 Tax=Bradyrhizobium diazoefficiens TaxID=1355477 RepID=UPI00190CE59F|nr:DUF3551 domain-containing protein [Bradyrhizobium diazoefficiens]MBK3663822.1 DUF3551 domain-containing protein [Bradyrhizobium diazoefficiens]